MLKRRQIIPPVTARTADGRVVQAWDFKQKRSLVIAFLRTGCRGCEGFVGRLAARAAALAEHDATALLIFSDLPPAALAESLPSHIHVAADVSGRSQRAFLGKDAFDSAGQRQIGVFVTDRYGELHAQWVGTDESALPGTEDVLGWLAQIQVACEECGAPHWNE